MKHIQVVYLGEPIKLGIILIKILIGVQSWGEGLFYTLWTLFLYLYIFQAYVIFFNSHQPNKSVSDLWVLFLLFYLH